MHKEVPWIYVVLYLFIYGQSFMHSRKRSSLFQPMLYNFALLQYVKVDIKFIHNDQYFYYEKLIMKFHEYACVYEGFVSDIQFRDKIFAN